jgi:hypothetical protein
MNNFFIEIYENFKMVFKEACQKKLLLKIFLLFGIYLLSNYILDRIDQEDLIRIFHNKPYIKLSNNIRLPNNIIFKFILILILLITSKYVYRYIIKPLIRI